MEITTLSWILLVGLLLVLFAIAIVLYKVAKLKNPKEVAKQHFNQEYKNKKDKNSKPPDES